MRLHNWIIICVTFIACSQTKKIIKNQSSYTKDTISETSQISEIEKIVKVDSILAESIKSNQQVISKLIENNKKDFWDKAAVVIQVIALAAIYFALQSLKNERSKRNMDFLSSINRLMIEHPELRFYKNVKRNDIQNTIKNFSGVLQLKGPFEIKISGTFDLKILNKIDLIKDGKPESISTTQTYRSNSLQDQIEFKSDMEVDLIMDIKSSDTIILYGNIPDDTYTKIRAYCFYILNNFETVLEGNNKQLKQGWINYFKSLYSNSSYFKKVVDESIKPENKTQFTPSFISEIEKLL